MRVALVAGPDPGHLIPVAGLGVRLQAAGHEVLVLTGDRWAGPLARDGFAFRALPRLAAPVDDRDAGHRLHARAAEMGAPLAELLRGERVDLVVADTLTRAGSFAAAALDLPWVEVIPHPLADPSVALPPFGTGWAPSARRDRWLAGRAARSVALGREQRRAAWAAAGLRAVAPAHRLVATLPALEPARPDWPDRTTVVGPLTWEPADVDLPVPVGDAPLLLVVGSTASGGGSADLLAAALESGPGWRIAAPTLARPGQMLPPPAVAGPGRLAPLLVVASAVLSTGGHGMVAAALRAGVPMVLLPGGGDQKEVAARAARAGAAIRIHRGRELAGALGRVRGLAAGAAAAGDVTGLPAPVPLVEAAAR